MWALVLAGGKSRRMGQPKAELMLGGASLLARVVEVGRQVAAQVVVVGDADAAARLGVRSASDYLHGAGPLAGLAGGLAICPEGLHAVLACDLPFLDAALLPRMEALADGADAVVPEVEGRRHPLCALYRRECLDAARACLDAGSRRMDDLLDRIHVRTVRPDDAVPARLARSVTNVNTPEDYRRARELLEGGTS